MRKLSPFKLIVFILLSSATIVSGIKAHIYEDPYYVNFYLKANSTQSLKGSAEVCDSKKSACEDVADLAPMLTKKRDPNSEKVVYSLVYPPHTKTHKQFTLIIRHGTIMTYFPEAEFLTQNETTVLMEINWDLDNSDDNSYPGWFSLERSQEKLYETKNWNTIQTALGFILVNIAIVLCAFFGYFAPNWCPAFLAITFTFTKIIVVSYDFRATLIIFMILLLFYVFKVSTEKQFVALALGAFVWELIYLYGELNKDSLVRNGVFLLTFLLQIALAFIARHLITGKINRLTIISSAYIGSAFPFIFLSMLLSGSLPGWFPYSVPLRHFFCLVAVVIQLRIIESFCKTPKVKEEVVLSENQNDVDSNHNSLTDQLL